MLNIVKNEWKFYKSFDSISPDLDKEYQDLITKKLKRGTENISKDCEKRLKRRSMGFSKIQERYY